MKKWNCYDKDTKWLGVVEADTAQEAMKSEQLPAGTVQVCERADYSEKDFR